MNANRGVRERARVTVVIGMLAMSALLQSAAPIPARAQAATTQAAAAHFRLVRCGPQREAACLAARVALSSRSAVGARFNGQLGGVSMVGPELSLPGARAADFTPVFGAPVLPTSSLGRTSLHGALMVATRSAPVAVLPATWRPPLLALPAFAGVADSASLPTAVRDALALGAEPPGIRSLLMLLVALSGVLLVAFVPRFAWVDHRQTEEDLAHQLAAARALLSTQELEQLRGSAPREARPRKPEDATKETVMPPFKP